MKSMNETCCKNPAWRVDSGVAICGSCGETKAIAAPVPPAQPYIPYIPPPPQVWPGPGDFTPMPTQPYPIWVTPYITTGGYTCETLPMQYNLA
jgi:hypothetical protein